MGRNFFQWDQKPASLTYGFPIVVSQNFVSEMSCHPEQLTRARELRLK
jgi:hypothetical protein